GQLLGMAALCVAVHLAAFSTGLWGARGLRLTRPNQIAVALSGSQKTLPVALILFDAYFRAYPLAVVPLAFFHLGQLVVDTFLAEWFAARTARVPVQPAGEDLVAEVVL